MKNNDVLRRVRYIFDFDDDKTMALFAGGGLQVNRAEISNWLKKEDDEQYRRCKDEALCAFLDGLIADRRGAREDSGPVSAERPNTKPNSNPNNSLNNNVVFNKLKIACGLKAEEVLALMQRGGVSLSKHELSALFRKPGHKHYRECKDQYLRAFLQGLQQKHRSPAWPQKA